MLSGVLGDSLGNAVAGATVGVYPPGTGCARGTVASAKTAADGSFSVSVSPGTYDVWVTYQGDSTDPAFDLCTENVDLTKSVDDTLTVPITQLTVTAENSDGDLLQGVTIPGTAATGGSLATFDLFPGQPIAGSNTLLIPDQPYTTGAAGTATIPLMPMTSPLTLAVDPPADSDLAPTTISTGLMTTNTSVTATLAGPVNTITVTNPGAQSSIRGTAITALAIKASDSDPSATLTYAASGLPAGLSIASATGVISGTPSAVGTSSVTVTVTDGTGASGTATFNWAVTAPPASPHGLIKATKLPPLVVDDKGGSVANGNPIQVWDRDSKPRWQTWTLVSKGTYDVIELTESPTHCLDVKGSAVANGTKIQLWSCKIGDVQEEWKPLATGQLEALYASSKRRVPVVLDDPHAGGEGTRLEIWQSTRHRDQFWTVP
jgi:beta-glucosidase